MYGVELKLIVCKGEEWAVLTVVWTESHNIAHRSYSPESESRSIIALDPCLVSATVSSSSSNCCKLLFREFGKK